jgi:hypothetical protein
VRYRNQRRAIGPLVALGLLLGAALPALAIDQPAPGLGQVEPSSSPTPTPVSPTEGPTDAPTAAPTDAPTAAPTGTATPSEAPTQPPVVTPTPSQTPQPTATAPPVILHGASLTVYFREGTRPLVGARVMVVADLGEGAMEAFAGQTDAGGAAHFDDLPYPVGGASFDWQVSAQLSTIREDGTCRTATDYSGSGSLPAAAGQWQVVVGVSEATSSVTCDATPTPPGNGSRGGSTGGGSTGGSTGGGGGIGGPRTVAPALTPPATDAAVPSARPGSGPVGLVVLLFLASGLVLIRTARLGRAYGESTTRR